MAAERRRRPAALRAPSVRTRTTLVATLVVAAALALGAIAFVGIVDRTLTAEVLASVRARGDAASALLESGVPPTRLVGEGGEDEFLQVVDAGGGLVVSSANLGEAPPIVTIAPGSWREVAVPFDDERFLAYVREATAGDERYRLIIGRTLEPVAEATELVAQLLGVGLPALLVLVAGTTWLVVGRALSPVERMRRGVDAISAAELHRRIERPAADDEIGRLADTMNRMLERLERAQARQRQLVSDTSHELRSPIASIRQQVEVALRHPEHAAIGPLSASVLADAERLQGLVDDLLLLARADELSLGLAARQVDLDDVVLAEGRRLRESTTLRVDLSGVSAARTTGDEAALGRALRNLVDNASRHAAGAIALSVAEAGPWAVVRVDDDGPGIAPGDRDRVFERFVRLDDARARDAGGGGLGLAIVRELVQAHHGEVEIGESPLGGARVEVRLPLAPE